MDIPRSDSPPFGRLPAIPALALLLVGFLLYLLIWGALDPPPTWTRCPPPSPSELAELSGRRDDFLPVAVLLAAVYAILLASFAWTWAANRRARQGFRRRPGRLVVWATVILGPLWVLLIGHAFSGNAVGGAIFWGFIIAAVGTVVGIALAIGVLAGLFHSPTRSRSEDAIDSLSVGLTWWLLLFVAPLFFIGIGVAGKNATLIC